MSKHYIGDYKSDRFKGNPWHPLPFVKGKIDTLPFDHDSVVMYHGGNISDFFLEDYTPEGNYQRKSLFITGEKNPGNTSTDNKHLKKPEEDQKFSHRHDAVFGGTLEVARWYAEHRSRKDTGLVYEFQLPAANLELLLGEIDQYLDVHRTNTRFHHCTDSEDIISLLGGDRVSAVQNLRKLIVELTKEGGLRAEEMQFGYTKPVEIERARSYWPTGYSIEPVFIGFTQLTEWLYSKEEFSQKLPNQNKVIEKYNLDLEKVQPGLKQEFVQTRHIHEEIKTIESVGSDLYDKIETSMTYMEKIFELKISRLSKIKYFARYNWYKRARNQRVSHPKEKLESTMFESSVMGFSLIEKLEALNRKLESLIEDLHFNPKRKKVSTLVEAEVEKEEFIQRLEALRNTMKKLEQEEKTEIAHKSTEGGRNKPDKEKIEKAIEQIMNEIPDFRPLESNIKEMKLEMFIQHNIEEMKEME